MGDMMIVRWQPRGVGSNGGWHSLVTGNLVEFGPDLSGFVNNRVDAYHIAEMCNPLDDFVKSDGSSYEDRCKIDFRKSEPRWLQVKLIVEPEHEQVLVRLSRAVSLRDDWIDRETILWAIDPDNNRTPFAIRNIDAILAKESSVVS